jgi:restriction system protein
VPDVAIPAYHELLWPTLQAVIAIEGSGRIDESNRAVIDRERFSEDQQAILHGNGPGTEIEYRLAWARSYLKGMGLLDNSVRGVWSVTERGRNVEPDEIRVLHDTYRRAAHERSRQRRREQPSSTASIAGEGAADEVMAEESDWKQRLLEVLLQVPPDRFERLARRLLREEGFINTSVTGRSGDGGIDGIGTYRMSLISFTVFFQCKRYAGSVGASAVRDFRGAMTGRGDKGLLITTGTFTADAQREATRDGAPPIDLIDGDALCELLKKNALGVETRRIEEIELRPGFFDEI